MKALITGITGQIGSYLAEVLLEKGYEVHGIARNKLPSNIPQSISSKINLHVLDISDSKALRFLISEISPDEIYNFAAQSNSQISFSIAEQTFNENALAVLHIAESSASLPKPAKIF